MFIIYFVGSLNSSDESSKLDTEEERDAADEEDEETEEDKVYDEVEVVEEMTDILKRYYQDNFSDWFQPGSIDNKRGESVQRRSSRKKNLHQKLVLSQYASATGNNSGSYSRKFSSAIKLDMDDRAKMIQYFSNKSDKDDNECDPGIRIEDMFIGSQCWSVPRVGPSIPTVITVQAPAGIGKSSMLKYMCMKWGCEELWNSNFDVLIFVECRTLNRLGPMSGKEFLTKILLDPIPELRRKYEMMKNDDDSDENNEEDDIGGFWEELTLKAAAGRVLVLLDGLDEVHGVGHLNNGPPGSITNKNPIYSMNGIQNGSQFVPSKSKLNAKLTPLEFTQWLLTGSVLGGCHVIVTSRPHTLSHLQSSRWFLSLPKRLVSLDIQGLSDEGVQSFIHR